MPDNADGDLYVDASCIDCAVCRVTAPATFARSERRGQSLVVRQPVGDAERLRAAMALVACPTASIGSRSKREVDVAAAAAAFPDPLHELAPDAAVYACGYAAESSYGAQSWLVVRPSGNVLVDSPRAAAPLFDRIEALGGVRWMFLTHRDDVADHAKIARRFGATRVMHEADVGPGTEDVERVVRGSEPARLADDLLVVPVPGHTRGSAALLLADTVLFTGDHLFATEDGAELYASRAVCWYSWTAQVRSLERLLDLEFRAVLPGHEGRMIRATRAAMRDKVKAAIRRAKTD